MRVRADAAAAAAAAVVVEEAAAEYDPLRDGPLRYLGYTNECGCAETSIRFRVTRQKIAFNEPLAGRTDFKPYACHTLQYKDISGWV